jgi:FGGY-family pentulose kinase
LKGNVTVYILAIDIGTEGIRVGLVNAHGKVVGSASSGYKTHYPHPSWAEQAPEDWWQAAAQATRACLANSRVAPAEIGAIGLDAFASTMVVCDQKGQPLRPAILWMDGRASLEAEEIERTGDAVLKYGGGHESVEWMLPRLLWLKRNQPDVYARAERIVEALDWFTYRLTELWTLSINQVTDLWHYVPLRGGWPLSLLRTIGLEDSITKFPERIYAIGDGVGELTAPAAAHLGLEPGIPVACGGVDAHVGLLGLNAINPGQMGLVIGSSTVQMALSPVPVFNPGFWGPFQDSILPGTWLLECGQVSTGSILHWYVQNMAPGKVLDAAQAQGVSPYAFLDGLADSLEPGAGGLIALDYWLGNRTPIRDPLARGALVGLTLYHTPAHIYRAFLESAAYGNYHIVETYREAGVEVREIVASGGGARSEVWIQMHADVCNCPILLASSADAMLVGSAIAGAVCAGIYPDIPQATAQMVSTVRRFEPDPSRHAAYLASYRDYRELYPGIRPILHRLSARGG